MCIYCNTNIAHQTSIIPSSYVLLFYSSFYVLNFLIWLTKQTQRHSMIWYKYGNSTDMYMLMHGIEHTIFCNNACKVEGGFNGKRGFRCMLCQCLTCWRRQWSRASTSLLDLHSESLFDLPMLVRISLPLLWREIERALFCIRKYYAYTEIRTRMMW